MAKTATKHVRRAPPERVRVIEHLGRTILHADFTNGDPDEVLEAFHYLWALAEARTLPYSILYDVQGNFANDEFVQYAKDFAKFTKKQGVSTGSAVLGVTGIKRIIARAIKPDLYWAKDKAEALRWLTQESRWEER